MCVVQRPCRGVCREMAVALHPDKCKQAQAKEAFQRLVKAYQNLAKYAH